VYLVCVRIDTSRSTAWQGLGLSAASRWLGRIPLTLQLWSQYNLGSLSKEADQPMQGDGLHSASFSLGQDDRFEQASDLQIVLRNSGATVPDFGLLLGNPVVKLSNFLV